MRRIGDVIVVSPSEATLVMVSAAMGSWCDGRIHRALTRQDALRVLGGAKLGLAVIDYDMPDAMVVAAACFNASVPFVTVNDDEQVTTDGGALACVSRPFNPARLIDALDMTFRSATRA